MKKYLFLISSAALLASCSNELLVSEDFTQDEAKTQGITFVLNDDATRGIIKSNKDGSLSHHFFAETDRLNVFSDALKGYPTSAPASWAAVTYKATKSSGNPMIAAASDTDILSFRASGTSSFLVAYPVDGTIDDVPAGGAIVKRFKPKNNNATQHYNNDGGFANNIYIGSAQVNSGSVTKDSAGFNDQIQLSLASPYATLVLNISDIANYATPEKFGKLNSIDLKPADNGASPLVLGSNDSILVNISNKTVSVIAHKVNPVNTINFTWEGEWNDNSISKPVFVLPADREVRESYEFVLHFDNIDLTWKQSTANDWNANTVYYDTLSIAKEFPYTITLGDATGDNRTLIFHKGSVNAAAVADINYVNWSDSRSGYGYVAKNKITKVFVEKGVNKMESADWNVISNMTNCLALDIQNATDTLFNISSMISLEYLKADSVKAVTETALGSLTPNIQTVILPSVVSYKDPAHYTSSLKKLVLSSYTFGDVAEDVAVNAFFNDQTKTSLEYIDISSVVALNPLFGYERTILFTDYTALDTIKLNKNTTVLCPEEFKGCTSLQCVIGVVDLEKGNSTSAFENCSRLDSVDVATTVIPKNTFKGCTSLYKVKMNGSMVKPTIIGSKAFYNTFMQTMDLSNVTTLGENAFKECGAFVGNNDANGIVTLNVEEVPDSAFSGTKVKRFLLNKAKKVGFYSLNSSELKQVKFHSNTGITPKVFVEPTNFSKIDVFVYQYSDIATIESLETTTSSYFHSITVDSTEGWISK